MMILEVLSTSRKGSASGLKGLQKMFQNKEISLQNFSGLLQMVLNSHSMAKYSRYLHSKSY